MELATGVEIDVDELEPVAAGETVPDTFMAFVVGEALASVAVAGELDVGNAQAVSGTSSTRHARITRTLGSARSLCQPAPAAYHSYAAREASESFLRVV